MKDSTIGRYRILEEIASGSSGRVYRGEDPQHKNAPVAIKLLHSANLTSAQEREHFLQEAHFLTMLKHPHILPVLDIGFEGNLPYIVTEFAAGGSLLDYLKKLAPRPLPTFEALTIVSQIGDALQYAHEQNIIHRDLKPANILFNAAGSPLLADFGIARVISTSMQNGTIIGTPSYMAPEQFRGTISKESDQYALGCITYELVTGRRPFNAADFFTLGHKHMSETPLPPTQLNVLLSHSLEQIIFKAMAKKRTDRYSSVAMYIAALRGDGQSTLSSTSPSATGSSQLPLPPSPPPVAIFNATAMPSASPGLPSGPSFYISTTPTTPATPATLDQQSYLSQSALQPESVQDTAPRLPVIKPYSPADSLPRAVASIPTQVPSSTSQHLPTLPGGFLLVDVGQSSRTGYETILMTATDTSVPLHNGQGYQSLPPQAGYGGVVLPTASMPVTSVPSVAGKYRRSGSRRLPVIAAILLLLLLITGASLVAALKLFTPPSSTLSTAAVAIIPTSPTQSNTYTITAVPTSPNPASLQVQARTLLARTHQSRTVASTGVGEVPATFASGSLLLYNDSTSPHAVAAGTIYTGSDGVQVMSLQSATVPAGNPTKNAPTWQSVTIPARAVKAGHSGNIVKNDVNLWTPNGSKGDFVVQNNIPFSGGRDTLYYSIVASSDLRDAATPVTHLLLRETQTAVLAQVQPGEQVVSSPLCTQQFVYDHHVGDHSPSLSVTISTACTLDAYDQPGAFALAINQLKNQLIARGQTLLPVFTATIVQAQVLNSKGVISLLVKASNTEFSDVQLQNMAHSIAGKNSSDAQTILLHTSGVRSVTIHINGGDGQTLPAGVTRITIFVAN